MSAEKAARQPELKDFIEPRRGARATDDDASAAPGRLIEITSDAQWHALRARHVGASEVAALFGVQPDYALSHWALWQVKAGRAEPPPVDNERAKMGLRLEPVIAELAAEREGWQIAKAAYYSDGAGMGCSLDYTIASDPAEDGPGVLELKNADWLVHRRTWTDSEPPEHILLQLQQQLALTDCAWGAVACLVGGNELRVYRYKRKPKIIAQIRRRVAEFWRSIDEGREPPIDGSESVSEILKQLYPGDDGVDEPVDMTADNELPELCARYLHAVEMRKEGEAAEKEARNGILAKLGTHRAARCEGFTIRAPVIPGKPDTVITPEMVGQVLKGRADSRRMNVREIT